MSKFDEIRSAVGTGHHDTMTDQDFVNHLQTVAKRIFAQLEFPEGTWGFASINDKLDPSQRRVNDQVVRNHNGAWCRVWIDLDGKKFEVVMFANNPTDPSGFILTDFAHAALMPGASFESFCEEVFVVLKDKASAL